MEDNKKSKKDGKYFEAVGRRKTSVARVRLMKDKNPSFKVNKQEAVDYFPTQELQINVRKPLETAESGGAFSVSALVKGGGLSSQADAIRLGVARALTVVDGSLRKSLKKEGLLKRDPRVKERRKFGLKKARKASQWSKR